MSDEILAIGFDTETTGLTKHPNAKLELQPHIIEFAAVLINQSGQIVDSITLLANPGVPLEAKITQITGLTDEDLQDEPPIAEVMPKIAAFFARADVMFAHNLPFDHQVVQGELQRLGIEDFPWPRIPICTVQEFFPVYGRRVRLLELYEDVMGKPLNQTHRALDDVEAMAEIVIKEKVIEKCIRAAAAQNAH